MPSKRTFRCTPDLVLFYDYPEDSMWSTMLDLCLSSLKDSGLPMKIILKAGGYSPPASILKKYSLATMLTCSEEKGLHRNVGWKLRNICRLEAPSIILDVDTYCLFGLDPLVKALEDKPYFCVPCSPIRVPWGGVQVLRDPGFFDWSSIIKHVDALNVGESEVLRRWSKAENLDILHPDIGYEWNVLSDLVKIPKMIDGRWQAYLKLDSRKQARIIHYADSRRPWLTEDPIFADFVERAKACQN